MEVFNFNRVASGCLVYEAPEVEVVRVVSEDSFCGSAGARAASCDDPDDFGWGGSL